MTRNENADNTTTAVNILKIAVLNKKSNNIKINL